jgi:diguanylate cyclase (GGDEF)-like protein
MTPEQWISVHPADLLETLREHLPHLPFSLRIFCPEQAPDRPPSLPPCGALADHPLCTPDCDRVRAAAVHDALGSGRPQVFHCPRGLLHFAVPFADGTQRHRCLLGGGAREFQLSAADLESFANAFSADGQPLLERVERLPGATLQQTEEAAEAIHRLLPALLGPNLHTRALEKTTRRLAAGADVAKALDRATSVEELLSLLGESLTVLYDIDGVLLMLGKDEGPDQPNIFSLGLPFPLTGVEGNRLREFSRRLATDRAAVAAEGIDSLCPGLGRTPSAVLPLACDATPFGLLALFGDGVLPRDLPLFELLAGRAAARIGQLRREQAAELQHARTARLVAMVGALALMESHDRFCQEMLAMAAELLEAESGSLMLLDEVGERLEMKAVRGLSASVARNLCLRPGSGIAGRVAKSGFPLLVADIEKDSRTASPNRPRFKTKSFLSVPVKLRERTLGVLNLADKENGASFSEADLQLLTTFTAHAALLSERVAAFEQVARLEELSVTDPLTGLYNRRFLEKRLEEELNRSTRQKLNFTLMIVDLDHFKAYNDLCGHLAGDQALKKTAGLLGGSAREMDVVTRYGGEEFCIVLPGTSKRESVFVAERIRRAIENAPFPREQELPRGALTASFGLAAFPDDGQSARALLGAADIALYQAKRTGRNRIVLCNPALLESRQETA